MLAGHHYSIFVIYAASTSLKNIYFSVICLRCLILMALAYSSCNPARSDPLCIFAGVSEGDRSIVSWAELRCAARRLASRMIMSYQWWGGSQFLFPLFAQDRIFLMIYIIYLIMLYLLNVLTTQIQTYLTHHQLICNDFQDFIVNTFILQSFEISSGHIDFVTGSLFVSSINSSEGNLMLSLSRTAVKYWLHFRFQKKVADFIVIFQSWVNTVSLFIICSSVLSHFDIVTRVTKLSNHIGDFTFPVSDLCRWQLSDFLFQQVSFNFIVRTALLLVQITFQMFCNFSCGTDSDSNEFVIFLIWEFIC